MKKKNLKQRVIITLLVTLIGFYVVFMPRGRRPHLSDFTYSGIKNTLSQNIKLGLDLRGGSHLVMRVRTDEYLKKLTENEALAAQNAAKAEGFEVKEARGETTGGNYRVVLIPADPAKTNEIREKIEKRLDLSSDRGWSYSESGGAMSWSLGTTAQRLMADQATDQAMKIIDTRINAVGVTEPTLARHGAQSSHQILLQMPGEQNPERIKALLKGKSYLELVHVISPPSPASTATYATREEAIASLNTGGTIPSNRRVYPYADRDEPTAGGQTNPTAPREKRWVVVESPSIVEGNELSTATAVSRSGAPDDYAISFSLKKSGAEKFGPWTASHINEYMGVVLDDEVKSIAFIKGRIDDSGEITGRFTKQSADDLALTLRSGALPAPIEYQEERTVGPSLGADSIRSGVKASVFGLLFVVAFILFYYRGAGVNAVVALLLNMLLMLAALIIFKATLTLPGIAGMILTIGMAVDSNVLIFERIREELLTGKTIASAVDQGFDRAIVTIIDTHVTTVISSLFLFVFGTGPLRGFAVTLILGLLINLFSAVYVSRTIFIWQLSRKRRVERLSI